MNSIEKWIKKATVIAIVLMVGVVSIPAVEASAGADESTAAVPLSNQVSNDRLQRVWFKEQRIYNKLGKFFDVVDGRILKGQALLDKAKANGKDVAAIQAALDTFSEAVKQTRPIYAGTQGIVSAHAGFDLNGNVTDPTLARQTVRMLKEDFKQIHQILHKPKHDLHQAIQNFRKANGLIPTPPQPDA